MSGVVKKIGKAIGGVVKGVGKVVKKAWPVIAIAALAYFTGGFGLAPGAMSTPGYGALLGGGAGQAAASPLASSGKIIGTALDGGMTQAGATQALTSNAAYTGVGVDSTIKGIAGSLQPNMSASQVTSTVDKAISTSQGAQGAAGADATRSALAEKMTSMGDQVSKSIPGVPGGEESLGFMGGLKKVFGKASGFIEEHPYASLMAFQTAGNMMEPSLDEQYEARAKHRGAFWGMESDGSMDERYFPQSDFAPRSVLSRARKAAQGQSPASPVQSADAAREQAKPQITQFG